MRRHMGVVVALLFLQIIGFGNPGSSAESESEATESFAERLRQAKERYWNAAKEKLPDQELKLKSEMEALIQKLDVKGYLAAVDAKKLDDIKSCCEKIDLSLGTDVLRHFCKAFEIEEREGPEEAKRYLQQIAQDEKTSEFQKKAILGMNSFLEAKGTITTKEAAILILVLAMESKFPHRGGILTLLLLDILGAAVKEISLAPILTALDLALEQLDAGEKSEPATGEDEAGEPQQVLQRQRGEPAACEDRTTLEQGDGRLHRQESEELLQVP